MDPGLFADLPDGLNARSMILLRPVRHVQTKHADTSGQ
jgi:hypothetical protein